MKTFTERYACTSRAHCPICLADSAWRKSVGAPAICPHGVTLDNLPAKRAQAARAFHEQPSTVNHHPFRPFTWLHFHIAVPVILFIQSDDALLTAAAALLAVLALATGRTFTALILVALAIFLSWLAAFNVKTCRCTARAARIDAWLARSCVLRAVTRPHEHK
jgi:hypothetical protein